MTLTTEQRASIRVELMRTADCPGAITKPQLVAVIDALDDWWETTGAASGNSVIPQPQRGILTNKQKARLFIMLLEARYKVT